jgi:hypothetical protein
MKLCCIALFSAAALSAQVSSVGIKPLAEAHSSENPGVEKRSAIASVPVLGYVLGTVPTDLHAILGTAKAPQIGAAIEAPAGSKRLYLPPRQHYALVEQTSDEAMSLWDMHRTVISEAKQEPIAVPGTMAHPDLVTFSPRGEAFVLYSQTESKVQIVGDAPVHAAIKSQLSLANLGLPSKMAISDDSEVLVVELNDGSIFSSSNGAPWQPLAATFTPQAWSFIPKTHDLVVSDTRQKMIVLLPQIEDRLRSARVISQTLMADELSVTKGGEELAAGNAATGQLWTIDLKSESATAREEETLRGEISLLRDGLTFIVYESPTSYLLTAFGSTSRIYGNR